MTDVPPLAESYTSNEGGWIVCLAQLICVGILLAPPGLEIQVVEQNQSQPIENETAVTRDQTTVDTTQKSDRPADSGHPAIKPIRTSWHTHFEEAQQEAKRTNLPLVVHFHADWCGPCQNMEREVLSSADLQRHLGVSVVGVKVNSDQQSVLTQRFRVTALPTDIFLSANGRETGRSVGSLGKIAYITTVTQLRSKSHKSAPATSPIGEARIALIPEGSAVKHAMAKEAGQKLDLSATPDIEVFRHHERDAGYVVGLNGHSPVTLVREGAWKPGIREFAVEHQGVSYRMLDEQEVAEFKANPDRYTPGLHGCDPVLFRSQNRLSAGKTNWTATHKDQIYFFADKRSREQFLADPNRYAVTQKLNFFRRMPQEVSLLP